MDCGGGDLYEGGGGGGGGGVVLVPWLDGFNTAGLGFLVSLHGGGAGEVRLASVAVTGGEGGGAASSGGWWRT